jgi:hypothetical protein
MVPGETRPIRILILGGYGTFGGRLAVLLADNPRLALLIAGRSLQKATEFCAALPSGAARMPLRFDRTGDVEAQLRQAAPDMIVDASGPFQAYGATPYRVVEAALTLGIDYLDLADGSDFVQGIAQFDGAARARGLFVLSGVSSFPVLTAGVVRRLAEGLQCMDSISAGIAPSPYAGVGLNVIRAISSYAGQPIRLIRAGKPAIGHGMTETMRYTIAPPGCLPLRNIRFSLMDVPDLQVLPGLWPQLNAIWVGAGPVPELLHLLLSALAWLVRWHLLPSLSPFAGIFYRVINIVRWGEHRGGMFVSIAGVSTDGDPVERSWHLLAEGDDGPLIPSMAAAAIVRRCLEGRRPADGARPATDDLELDDYDALFARREIRSGRREVVAETGRWPLYRRILGDAWASLPTPLQAMHDGTTTAEGVATVERGANLLARIAAAVFHFPAAGNDVPVEVTFASRDGGEIWRRSFAGRAFASTQSEGRGRFDKLIAERFGPFTFGLALVLEESRLCLAVRRWSFLGLPLPLSFAPRGQSYETVENGRFHFHVEIGHPLTGLIVRYRGWLVPR